MKEEVKIKKNIIKKKNYVHINKNVLTSQQCDKRIWDYVLK